MEAKEPAKELVLIDVKQVVDGNRLNYEKYAAKLAHASPLLRGSMLKGYSEAIDDMCKLLDRAKQE